MRKIENNQVIHLPYAILDFATENAEKPFMLTLCLRVSVVRPRSIRYSGFQRRAHLRLKIFLIQTYL